jgi:hypothetical protein
LVSDKVRKKRILNSFKEEINREKDKDIESGQYILRPDVDQRILDLFEVEDSDMLIYLHQRHYLVEAIHHV